MNMRKIRLSAIWVIMICTISVLAQAAGADPVDFTFLGVKPGEIRAKYKITINTDKKVTQVDFSLKCFDVSGTVLGNTTVVWQNIVTGEQKPIEKGKTYEAAHRFPEGSTRCDAKLQSVHFEGGTTWEPAK